MLETLHAVELAILASEGQELVVRALLDYLPVVEYADEVSMLDGAESVRNDQGGSIGHQVDQSLLYQAL